MCPIRGKSDLMKRESLGGKIIPGEYTVKKIWEADYGCEEQPDGYVEMDTVILRAEDGTECRLRVPDAQLVKLEVEEGSQVTVDAAGIICGTIAK